MQNKYKINDFVPKLKAYFKKYKSRFTENIYYEICELLDAMLVKDISGKKSVTSVFQKIKRNFEQENDRFTFVLGAGVSNDFGIPNWEELIYRLNFSGYWERTHCGTIENNDGFIFDNEKKGNLKPLFRSQNNLYEWAQYAENNFNLEIDFRNKWLNVPSYIRERDLNNRIYCAVKKSLYYDVESGSESYKTITAPTSAKTIYNKELKKCSLSCIGKIIRKYNMDRVITYNYDDCLEYVMKKYSSDSYLPIFDKDQLSKKSKKCAIYHVHGFIPHFSEFKEGGKRFKEIKTDFDSWDGRRLILTEVSYDEMSDEIYKWRNAVQVDTFLRYNCFFIGFSATDINFKRIVKQLTRKTIGNTDLQREHYMSVCLDDCIGKIPQTKETYYDIDRFIVALENDELSENLYPYISSVFCMLIDKKKYLERYNITPLFTTIADLPYLLGELV